jgi:hypothetical protein
MPVAEVLPLPTPMRLVKGHKATREEPRNEEILRFPAVQEPWEISCETFDDWDDASPEERCRVLTAGKRYSRPAVA